MLASDHYSTIIVPIYNAKIKLQIRAEFTFIFVIIVRFVKYICIDFETM